MLVVLQRHCAFMPCFLVLWYPGGYASEETQITLLKTAQKFPGGKREERTQSVVIHPSNPAPRHFTAVLDPPAPRISLDLFSAFTEQLHLRCSLDLCPNVLDTVQEPQRQGSKRWTQTAGLRVITAWYRLLGFYLPAKLCFESFHSLVLLSLFIGEAHLVPFPPFHFSPSIASGMD